MEHRRCIRKPLLWNIWPLREKIRYYARHLTSDFAPYVDKLSAKRIAQEACGEDLQVARVIRTLEGPRDITDADFVDGRILKSAHASRWNFQLRPGLDMAAVHASLDLFNQPFLMFHEQQYKTIRPKFFIEEMIEDSVLGRGNLAIVYMMHCVHGTPLLIRTEKESSRNTYTLNWNLIGKEEFPLPRPGCLAKMIQCARRLSAPFEYVRMDFFIGKNDVLYFSEFTFTPAAGTAVMPLDVERIISRAWSQ